MKNSLSKEFVKKLSLKTGLSKLECRRRVNEFGRGLRRRLTEGGVYRMEFGDLGYFFVDYNLLYRRRVAGLFVCFDRTEGFKKYLIGRMVAKVLYFWVKYLSSRSVYKIILGDDRYEKIIRREYERVKKAIPYKFSGVYEGCREGVERIYFAIGGEHSDGGIKVVDLPSMRVFGEIGWYADTLYEMWMCDGVKDSGSDGIVSDKQMVKDG